jgi:hypothetical protein
LNMKVVNGQNDQRCVCGATHVQEDVEYSVVVRPGTQALTAYLCSACGRLSATYDRYSIDSARARQSLQTTVAPTTTSKKRARADASLDDVSASGDSLDLFVQTLLVSFNTGAVIQSPKKRAALVTPKSAARKRLFTPLGEDHTRPLRVRQVVNNDDESPMGPPVSEFVYGNRSISCRHASLTEMHVPRKDGDLIHEMIKV